MPVTFLSNEQAARYGRYASEPSPEQLARYFYLSDSDHDLVAGRRRDHNRLGFAVQLGTVRFLGTFLADPTDVPDGVVAYLAQQLEIGDPGCLPRYLERPATYRDHAKEIKQRFGYRDFTEQLGHFRLVRWLYTRAWVSDERPSVLFDLATARMVEQKILLPGVSVLARLVAQVRERASRRLYEAMARLVGPEQRQRLEALLVVPEGERVSPLERLRRAPTRISTPSLLGAISRLGEVSALGVSHIDTSTIPAGRRHTLARYAAGTWAPRIARMTEQRRTATLLAFAQHFEAVALDDALDVLDLLIDELLTKAKKEGHKQRLASLSRLDTAALTLREACQILLSLDGEDEDLRARVFQRISRAELAEAVETVGTLSRSPEDHYYDLLGSKYRTIRRFLPTLLRSIQFSGTDAARPVLDAIDFLRRLEAKPALVQLQGVSFAITVERSIPPSLWDTSPGQGESRKAGRGWIFRLTHCKAYCLKLH